MNPFFHGCKWQSYFTKEHYFLFSTLTIIILKKLYIISSGSFNSDTMFFLSKATIFMACRNQKVQIYNKEYAANWQNDIIIYHTIFLLLHGQRTIRYVHCQVIPINRPWFTKPTFLFVWPNSKVVHL